MLLLVIALSCRRRQRRQRTVAIPARVQGTLIPSPTRRALDHRSTEPEENRPATVSTMKHSHLLTYLLTASLCRPAWCRRANRGNGVWRRNCVQICLRGATHKLLSDVQQLLGEQPSHVTIQLHCKQSNRFESSVISTTGILFLQHVSMRFTLIIYSFCCVCT